MRKLSGFFAYWMGNFYLVFMFGMEQNMDRLATIFRCMGAVALALVCVACGKAPQDSATMSKGHMLTELVFDRDMDASDPDVLNTERVLHDASSRMGESESKLAEMAWYFTKELRKKGIHESGIDALETCSRVADRMQQEVDFSACGSHYVVARFSGMSHTDAVLGLVGLAGISKKLIDATNQ